MPVDMLLDMLINLVGRFFLTQNELFFSSCLWINKSWLWILSNAHWLYPACSHSPLLHVKYKKSNAALNRAFNYNRFSLKPHNAHIIKLRLSISDMVYVVHTYELNYLYSLKGCSCFIFYNCFADWKTNTLKAKDNSLHGIVHCRSSFKRD